MNFPTVSVVMPVKNEALKIKACIEGILAQTVPVNEIIVVDSGSADGTLEILELFPQVQVFKIPSSEFNHGLTRNLGVSMATGEFVILTVGDAQPANEFWIEELLKGFLDENVVAVCGQQIVPHHKDKNPVDWFRPVSQPKLKRWQYSLAEFEVLDPVMKKAVCSWDDVTAMYRRNILSKIPFQKTPYCEDAIWAREAVMNGHAIVYNPAARVYHYHNEDADFSFKRCFTTIFMQYRYFGLIPQKPQMPFLAKLRMVKLLAKSLLPNVNAMLKWHRYNTQNFNARKNAFFAFMEARKKGEDELDNLHTQLCGKPPVPLKTL